MRARDLDRAIAAANPLGRERARALALGDGAALLEAIAAEPLPAAPVGNRGGRRRRGLRVAAAMAVLLAALVAAGLFTAPGRAVGDWVGERLGLGGPGEPGGPPALRQLNEKWNQAMGLRHLRQNVLLVGPVTGRYHHRWEFITFDPPPRRPGHPNYGRGPCFKLDLTQERGMQTVGCGLLPQGRQFEMGGVGGDYGTPYEDAAGKIHFRDELLTLDGRAGPAVASVSATFRGREIPVQLRPVPAALRRRFHLGGPFSFFVAFVTDSAYGGTLEVRARGAGGEQLGHWKVDVFSQVKSSKLGCLLMRRHQERETPAEREQCRVLLGPGG